MTRFDIREDHPAALGIDAGHNSSRRLFFSLQPNPEYGIASFVSRQLRSISRLPKQIDMAGVKEERETEVANFGYYTIKQYQHIARSPL